MTRKEESKFRSKITDALRPLKAFAVENQLCLPGTPDVFYDGKVSWDEDGEYKEDLPKTRYCGQIEAKRGVLPVRASTKFSVDIQPGQKPFWADAHERGAVVYVLVQVEPRQAEASNCYLQLDAKVAVEHLDVSSFDILRAVARSWIQLYPGDHQQLKRWIRRCVMV
jgi:hypothetical protein